MINERYCWTNNISSEASDGVKQVNVNFSEASDGVKQACVELSEASDRVKQANVEFSEASDEMNQVNVGEAVLMHLLNTRQPFLADMTPFSFHPRGDAASSYCHRLRLPAASCKTGRATVSLYSGGKR